MKRLNTIMIVALMIGGSVSILAYYIQYAVPNCGSPPQGGTPTTHGVVGSTTINGQPYYQLNVTFTAVLQQVSIGTVSYQTSSFSDPSISHQVGFGCGTDPKGSYSADITINFSDGSPAEKLSIAFGGNPPVSGGTPLLTSHVNPRAGVERTTGTMFLTLLLSHT